MSRTIGIIERRHLTTLSALAACALFGLSCGEGTQGLSPDSLAPDKNIEAVTGDNGSCTPILCPASSPVCPVGLHCFEGTCLDADCKPACQFSGASGEASDAGEESASLPTVTGDAGDATDGGAGGLVTPCDVVCGPSGCGKGCVQGANIYGPGTLQPGNPCVICQAGGTWDNVAAGQSCSTGGACVTGQSCDGSGNCSVGGPACTSAQTCCPTESTLCVDTTSDPHNCGGCGVRCPVGKACGGSVCILGCTIAGVAYAPGQANPANPCLVCNTASSTSVWTHASTGSSCGVGICIGGACTSACAIGGSVYLAGTTNPANWCEVCAPATSPTTWSNQPDGTQGGTAAFGCTAASKQICAGGLCSSSCEIAGSPYAAGAVDPVNACEVCTPASSVTTWTALAAQTSCGAGAICVTPGPVCLDDCHISGNYYASGTVDPSNACLVCQSAASTTGWSNEPTGLACAAGRVCNASGNCAVGCFIGGALYSNNQANPANPCQICTPATSTTAWSEASAGAACGTGQVCDGAGNCASDCYTGGTLYAAGTEDPANVCVVCTPSVATSGWTNGPAGVACAVGKVCNAAGACSKDCFIGGTLYASGAANPANACLVCTPTTSTTTWSNQTSGTSCGTGDVCNATGTCSSDCFISGVLYSAGQVDPTNACLLCTPATSTTAWSDEPAGLACATGEVCNAAGACTTDCFIGGVLYTSTTANPANACQVCTPATSTTSWSNKANGTACGTGDVCNAGACAADCFISGVLYTSGQVDPANACLMCTPATSTTAWSDEPAGLACATGEVCSAAGACAADCFIGGVLYTSTTANPANACQVCTPATSTTSWSNKANGTACGTGDVCSAGACSSDCFISGVLYSAGQVDPANACLLCTPATSTTAWSDEPAGLACGSGDVCNATGTCSADCFIGGVLYASGTADPANACLVCTPATSTTAWSDKASGTACGTGEVCNATGTCSADCFIGGVLYASGTADPANACLVCTPATSTTAWSDRASGTACGTGEVCNATGTCSADCFIGGVLYASGTVDPANACLVCTPTTSTTAWSDEPAGHSCAPGGTTHLCSGAGVCN